MLKTRHFSKKGIRFNTCILVSYRVIVCCKKKIAVVGIVVNGFVGPIFSIWINKQTCKILEQLLVVFS